jgi:hypothetical protein
MADVIFKATISAVISVVIVEVADNIYQTYKDKCGKCEEAELEVRHEKRYRPYDESKYNDCIEACLKMLPTGRQDGFPFFKCIRKCMGK